MDGKRENLLKKKREEKNWKSNLKSKALIPTINTQQEYFRKIQFTSKSNQMWRIPDEEIWYKRVNTKEKYWNDDAFDFVGKEDWKEIPTFVNQIHNDFLLLYIDDDFYCYILIVIDSIRRWRKRVGE